MSDMEIKVILEEANVNKDFFTSNRKENNLKCPFCQQELDCMGKYTDGSSKWLCNKCGLFGDKKLFDEIIRTRKALDVAVNMLKDIDETRSVANHKIGTQDKTLNSGIVFCWTTPDEVHNALEQITALEQKD